VAEVLLELVADRALGVGIADVVRHLVELVRSQLGATRDEPDLWAIAVADRDLPALLDDRGDVPARLAQGGVLVGHRHVGWVLDGELPPIATTRTLLAMVVPLQRMVRARTAVWTWSRFSAWS
jgi:hypothetical protein